MELGKGKWGYLLLNGVVVACAGGKVIYTETLTKHCNQCKYWAKGFPPLNLKDGN